MRYYEGTKTSCSHPAGFTRRWPNGTNTPLLLSLRPETEEAVTGPGPFGSGGPDRSVHDMEVTGSPKFPGNPVRAYAELQDPGQAVSPRHDGDTTVAPGEYETESHGNHINFGA